MVALALALALAIAPVYKRAAIALVVFAIAAGLAAKQLPEFQKQEPAAKVVATPTLESQ